MSGSTKATKKAESPGAEAQSKQIVIKPMDIRCIKLPLEGISPLVCHRWSEKARQQMLDKQMKKADAGQPVKDPEADYRSSLYPFPGGGYGFPALAFKSAAVDACSQLTGLTKVQTRGAFHVIGTQTDDGQLVKIEGAPRMREDMVRLNGTTADIRYRAEFPTWKTTLSIHYNHGVFSDEQIVNLFNVAGFAVGIGEWRPARDGNWGMFQVAARKGKQG